MPPDPIQHETKLRLIEAAGEVFAEHGFQAATVRDICHKADANIAAVNYHFGGKEELYREVLAYSFLYGQEKHPLSFDAKLSPAELLGQFVRVTVERILGEGKPAWHGKLISREMAQPTGAMEQIAGRYMKPHFAALKDILRQIVGEAAPERRVTLLGLSVMAQITFYMMGREACMRVAPEVSTATPEDRDEIAAHITAVTLASCRAGD
jgi:AcrR family transcriptional regulator